MANDIEFFQLNTGAKIPSVALGTWQADPGVVSQAVEIAIKVPSFFLCLLFYTIVFRFLWILTSRVSIWWTEFVCSHFF